MSKLWARWSSMNAGKSLQLGSRVREGEQVEIGGNSRYEAVWARCFYAGLPT